MITIKYNGGYIHDNFTSGIITVQVSEYAMPIKCKSFRAAQLYITKTRKLEKQCLERMGIL